MRTQITSAILVLLVAMLANPVSAQVGPATRQVRTQHDSVLRIIRRRAATPAEETQRTTEVTRILGGLLDYEELSRRALAQHWTEQPEAERTRFVAILRQLVERSYRDNLQRVAEFEVTYLREAPSGSDIVVYTSARSRTARRQPPVNINYTVRLVGSVYRVIDINTDGRSLVQNYQSQFHRIISQNGWPELMRRMQERLQNPASR